MCLAVPVAALVTPESSLAFSAAILSSSPTSLASSSRPFRQLRPQQRLPYSPRILRSSRQPLPQFPFWTPPQLPATPRAVACPVACVSASSTISVAVNRILNLRPPWYPPRTAFPWDLQIAPNMPHKISMQGRVTQGFIPFRPVPPGCQLRQGCVRVRRMPDGANYGPGTGSASSTPDPTTGFSTPGSGSV